MAENNFASLGLQNAPEVITPVQLPVRGSLPPWLSGALYRTGPGTFQIKSDSNKQGIVNMHHWFDGPGMHHKFEIKENGTEVWYQSRKCAETLEQRIAQQGKHPSFSFGQSLDPCETLFSRFFTFFITLAGYGPQPTGLPNEANTCVTIAPAYPLQPTGHTNERNKGVPYMIARTDSTSIQFLNTDTLEPIQQMRYQNIDPRLSGDVSAAHGSTDHNTGDYFNFSLKLGGKPCYTVFAIRGGRLNPEEKDRVDILAKITEAPAAYLHSSFMTEKYVIIAIWQADYTMGGLSMVFNRNVLDGIDKTWKDDRPTFYYVIDKCDGGIVAKYKSDPYFAFHTINAYEEDDDVILDVSVLPKHTILWDFGVATMCDAEKFRAQNSPMATARRYRLAKVSSSSPTTYGNAQQEFNVPVCKGIELPTVHPNKSGKRYRYAYGISKVKGESVISDRLIKLDMDDPSISYDDVKAGAKVWTEEHSSPGEPIFVPRPYGEEEDDGIVLSVVLDGKVGRSMLLVLNAQDMTEVGRAVMNHPFPFGFHGSFVS